MAILDCIRHITACLCAAAAMALPCAGLEASDGDTEAAEKSGLMCDQWGMSSTTDQSVDLAALEGSDAHPSIMFVVDADNHYLLAMISNMDEVFPDDVYNSHEDVRSERRTTNLESAFIHRTIKADLIDIMAVSGLETDTPQLTWHRLRLDQDMPHETLLVASCKR